MREFQDKFTCDGALAVPAGVTFEKVAQVGKLLAEAKRGNRVSEARLVESMFTGQIASSVAHFINTITLPQLPEDKDRPVAKLAGFRTVPDFRPAMLYSLYGGKVEGPGIDDNGAAAVVPQGQPFPEVTISGVESAYAKLRKRGLRVDWDFEDFINDAVGVLDMIPGELRDIVLETEWQEVGDALLKATTKQSASVTIPGEGTTTITVPVDAKIGPEAIMGAIYALGQRTVNGEKRKIGTLSSYRVVVAPGKKLFVDHAIRVALSGLYVLPGTSGLVTRPMDRSILESVEVVEHEKVTGDKWYLMPAPGAYRRPVIDVLRLRGYETPQIRVRTEGGDGFSFDADTASMRLRHVVGSALWFQEAVLFSAGTAAITVNS